MAYLKKTNLDLILTRDGESKGSWKLPQKYFSNSETVFLNRLNWLDSENCFVNNYQRGQEYILDAEKYPRIIDWARINSTNMVKELQTRNIFICR